MPTLTGRRVTTQLRIHERMPQYIERMAQRSSKYLYHIVEEVEKRNLPTELALLPFVESAFQPELLVCGNLPPQRAMSIRCNRTFGKMTDAMFWKAREQHSIT